MGNWKIQKKIQHCICNKYVTLLMACKTSGTDVKEQITARPWCWCVEIIQIKIITCCSRCMYTSVCVCVCYIHSPYEQHTEAQPHMHGPDLQSQCLHSCTNQDQKKRRRRNKNTPGSFNSCPTLKKNTTIFQHFTCSSVCFFTLWNVILSAGVSNIMLPP